MREYRYSVQARSSQQRTVRLAVSPDVMSSPRGRTQQILQLQRTLGNHKVGQLLQSKRLTRQGRLVGVQPKLIVGAADDQYEREADHVARQVMTTPNMVASHSVQRAISSEEGKAQMLQTQSLAASIIRFMRRQMGDDEQSEGKEKPVQAKFLTEISGDLLQRQPKAEHAGTITDSDRRQFVRDATAYFTRAAQHFATVTVDAAAFERVINAWYALLANREELIKELGGRRDAYACAAGCIHECHSRADEAGRAPVQPPASGPIPGEQRPYPDVGLAAAAARYGIRHFYADSRGPQQQSDHGGGELQRQQLGCDNQTGRPGPGCRRGGDPPPLRPGFHLRPPRRER